MKFTGHRFSPLDRIQILNDATFGGLASFYIDLATLYVCLMYSLTSFFSSRIVFFTMTVSSPLIDTHLKSSIHFHFSSFSLLFHSLSSFLSLSLSLFLSLSLSLSVRSYNLHRASRVPIRRSWLEGPRVFSSLSLLFSFFFFLSSLAR